MKFTATKLAVAGVSITALAATGAAAASVVPAAAPAQHVFYRAGTTTPPSVFYRADGTSTHVFYRA